jgi:hypothetical protein
MSAYPAAPPTTPRRVRVPAPTRKKAQLAAPAPTRTLQPHEIEAELAHREAAHDRLMSFITYVYPYYYPSLMNQLIASALEMVEARQIRNLMVLAPPQHGKSAEVSQFFPPWYLGRNPDHDIILCSYNASLAEQHSFRARQIFREDRYSIVFPGVQLAQRSKSLKHWRIEDHRGSMKTAGVGGGVTGFGARCFPANTLVATERGAIPIRALHRMAPVERPRVFAYNHSTGVLELRQIVATKERMEHGSLVDITTQAGKRVRATADHRFYVEGEGYREAALLTHGTRLLGLAQEPQNLPVVWRNDGSPLENVSGVLLQGEKRPDNARVRSVRGVLSAPTLRGRKSAAQRLRSHLLLPRVRRARFGSQYAVVPEAQGLCSVPGQTATAQHEILLPGVSQSSTPAQNQGEVPNLRGRVRERVNPQAVLLEGVRERGSLGPYEGQGQLALQDRHQLRQVVRPDAALDTRTRHGSVRRVPCPEQASVGNVERAARSTLQSGDTPHRREPREQQGRQPYDALHNLSRHAPQVRSDTVALVRTVRTHGIAVYDIQVEGCHNFFANGVLVHNCLLIDDPLRGWKDANSEIIRQQQINWYDSEADTRVAPFDGVRVLCFTHWHEADIGGILLKRQATGGQLWHVLRLPALAETPQQTREWCDRHNVTPDRYLVADQPVDAVAALYGSYRRRPDQTDRNGPTKRVQSLKAVVDTLMGRSSTKKAQKEAPQADFEGFDVEVGDFPS